MGFAITLTLPSCGSKFLPRRSFRDKSAFSLAIFLEFCSLCPFASSYTAFVSQPSKENVIDNHQELGWWEQNRSTIRFSMITMFKYWKNGLALRLFLDSFKF